MVHGSVVIYQTMALRQASSNLRVGLWIFEYRYVALANSV